MASLEWRYSLLKDINVLAGNVWLACSLNPLQVTCSPASMIVGTTV